MKRTTLVEFPVSSGLHSQGVSMNCCSYFAYIQIMHLCTQYVYVVTCSVSDMRVVCCQCFFYCNFSSYVGCIETVQDTVD